jgi:hypothetical protein
VTRTTANFSEADAHLGHITLEGAAAIKVIGAALPRLSERGVVEPTDFPLLRALYEVIGKDQPLQIPWDSMFGGEPVTAGKSETAAEPVPTSEAERAAELAHEPD